MSISTAISKVTSSIVTFFPSDTFVFPSVIYGPYRPSFSCISPLLSGSSPNSFNEIPFATGSLGHGFPQAVGIALSNKLKKNDLKTYVLLSDGETNEGTTWEAAHFSVVKELTNLIVIIDDNKLQGFGKTSEVLGDTSRISKFNEIGFDTFECSGHNISDILKVLREIEKTTNNKPKLILANTIKGKGVSFMENKLEWHYLPINDELLSKSISDVENYTF